MRLTAKEAFENNLSNYKAMQEIVRAYVNKPEYSVQEAVYHALTELHLRKIFKVYVSLIAIFQENVSKFLKSETELNMLPGHSTDVFKRNNVDRYINRPNKIFCHRSYQVLDSFSFAEFLHYYTPVYYHDQQHEYQPNVLLDQLIKKNHEACVYRKTFKLMNYNVTMKCCKVKRVLRYHVLNKDMYPENLYTICYLCFTLFRSEDEFINFKSTNISKHSSMPFNFKYN